MGIVILVAVVVVVALFASGFARAPGLGTSNLGNGGVDGCAAACANLLAKRNQTCSHRAAVAAATAFRNSAAIEAAAAVAASIAASIAVGIVAAVPIIGPILATALAIAATAAAAYAIHAMGLLAGAAAALAVQLNGLAGAVRIEAEAVTLVTNSCPPDEAARCISSLPACPV